MLDTIFPFFLIILACYLLKYSCDTFEQAAGYLGRNFQLGLREQQLMLLAQVCQRCVS